MNEQQLAKGLFQAGLLSAEQIQTAVKQRESGRSFSQAVLELGFIEETQLQDFLPEDSQVQETTASNGTGSFTLVPIAEEAKPVETQSAPAATNGRASARASAQVPSFVEAVSNYQTNGHMNGRSASSNSAVATAPTLAPVSNNTYSNGTAKQAANEARSVGLGQDDIGFLDSAEVLYDGEDPNSDDGAKGPTVRWCNELLKIAVQTRASDMHLEPRPDGLLPRYRIDGHLRPGNLLPREYMPAVISRFKVLGQLDIAEQRLPQDGRFRATVGGRLFDFRVSTLPGMHGEKIVLRLLDRSSLVTDMSRLGFAPHNAKTFEEMLLRSHGMILVTGPTGSGKTTTLYAALAAANDETKNVITVEDPVEYELEGVTQTKVQPGIGLTFAAQLRAILRQDPDVILVGEIRDGETADIAIRAALTGHLVLSTLHTNSAVGAVTRLQDMGVPPFLIASSLSGVVAQRLVRMICKHCRAPLPKEDPQYRESIERLRLPEDSELFHGTGCKHCSGTGMRGRLALVELLEIESPMRKAIMAKEDAGELRKLAIQSGMKTLWQDGIEKLLQGLTTGPEIMRVLLGHEDEE